MKHLDTYGECIVRGIRDAALGHMRHTLQGSWALAENNTLRRELEVAGFTAAQIDLCWRACCEAVDVTVMHSFSWLDTLSYVEVAADWEGDGERQVLRLPSEDLHLIDLVEVYQDEWVPKYSEVVTDQLIEPAAKDES